MELLWYSKQRGNCHQVRSSARSHPGERRSRHVTVFPTRENNSQQVTTSSFMPWHAHRFLGKLSNYQKVRDQWLAYSVHPKWTLLSGMTLGMTLIATVSSVEPDLATELSLPLLITLDDNDDLDALKQSPLGDRECELSLTDAWERSAWQGRNLVSQTLTRWCPTCLSLVRVLIRISLCPSCNQRSLVSGSWGHHSSAGVQNRTTRMVWPRTQGLIVRMCREVWLCKRS